MLFSAMYVTDYGERESTCESNMMLLSSLTVLWTILTKVSRPSPTPLCCRRFWEEHLLTRRFAGAVLTGEEWVWFVQEPQFWCRYSREESFTALNIDIRNQQHLFESLDAFVKGDLLEGANAYHCEKCDKKVSSRHLSRVPSLLSCR